MSPVSEDTNDVFKQVLSALNLLLYKKATGAVLQKKVFLKISQNSQENTCAGVSF